MARREARDEVPDRSTGNDGNGSSTSRRSQPQARGLDRRTSYRFSIIARRQTRCLADMHASRFGLSVNGWKLLSVIEHFGPLSASEAGDRTSLEPANVTRGIDALADQGLVLRREDPADRRRTILSLSAKGKRIHDKIEQVSRALEQELLRVLRPAERDALDRMLDRLERRSAKIFVRSNAWRDILRAPVDATASRPGPTGEETPGALVPLT
jgi:DNA-binding MarR family transcriptional regulator